MVSKVYGATHAHAVPRFASSALTPMIARRIAETRVSMGLTQQALAQRLSIDPKNVQRIEAGRTDFKLSTIESVAEALGVDPLGWFSPRGQPTARSAPAGKLDFDALVAAGYAIVGPEQRAPTGAVPITTLRSAASHLSHGQHVEVLGWLRMRGRSVSSPSQRFVAQVDGRAMEPDLPEGSFCLFEHPMRGDPQGRIVLVQMRGTQDPETGASHAVKRLGGVRATSQGRLEVRLESINPAFAPYALPLDDPGSLNVVAGFVRALTGASAPRRAPRSPKAQSHPKVRAPLR